MSATIWLLFVVALVALFPTPTLQQPTPNIPTFIDFECLNRSAGNYTQGSPFQQNLNTLLSSLESNSSSSSFYATSVGESSSNDTAYGRYFCRHDLPLSACSSCVGAATKKIVASCPTYKEALVYFEQCTLYYLNSSSRLEYIDQASPWVMWYTPINVTDQGSFAPVLKATISRAINESAYWPGSGGFGTEEGRVSSFQTLYSLTQCSPDRVGLLCERCLNKALLEVGYNLYVHVAFFYPNCQLRYSVLSPFYNVSNPPPPTPPPSVPSPSPPTQVFITPPGNWAIARMSNNVLNLGIFMALSALMLGN